VKTYQRQAALAATVGDLVKACKESLSFLAVYGALERARGRIGEATTLTKTIEVTVNRAQEAAKGQKRRLAS
jgi:hypothetical protein